MPWCPLEALGGSVAATGIDKNIRPRRAGCSFAFGAQAVVRASLYRYRRLVQPEGLRQVGPHRSQVRAEPNRPQHDEGVDVPDREPCSFEVPGELANEVQRPGVLGIGVVLGEVRPQISVSNGTGQRVDQGMAEHVAIGVGVKTNVGWDEYAAKNEVLPVDQAADVVPDAGPALNHGGLSRAVRCAWPTPRGLWLCAVARHAYAQGTGIPPSRP